MSLLYGGYETIEWLEIKLENEKIIRAVLIYCYEGDYL
jgi:hypothetical protein